MLRFGIEILFIYSMVLWYTIRQWREQEVSTGRGWRMFLVIMTNEAIKNKRNAN